jgi:predicted ArsR family transcriptional regulator
MSAVPPLAEAQSVPGRRDLVLRLLRTSTEPRSIASLADEMAVHPNTVRFHLDALVRGGRVEQLVGETAGPGRPPTLFRVSRRMDPAGPTNYRLLASILVGYLTDSAKNPDAAAAELGREWGPSLIDREPRRAVSKTESVTELTEILASLGFRPESPTGRRSKELRLRHCPFHDLVQTHGTVICAVHLGLMQGALSAMRAPVTVDQLDAFVEPDLCVAYLAPAPKHGSAGSGGRRSLRSTKAPRIGGLP